jgi:hypothetical protein
VLTFVFSNPRHHLDMMVPVAKILDERRVPYEFVSLAELRGFATPSLERRLAHSRVRRAFPRIRKNPSAGSGVGTGGSQGAVVRSLVQHALWRGVLSPRLRWLLRRSDVVALPNDAAFPYDQLAASLRARGVPFVLLQEGIRFPLPTEQNKGLPYGGGGAQRICVWGEASALHFRNVAPAHNVCVTGNPRFDTVDPSQWRAAGEELRTKLGLAAPPLLYLSNTIDDQGFCTTAEKMQLFERFLEQATPVARRHGAGIVVKLHAREDVSAFRVVAARHDNVHVLGDAPLFAVLAMGRAAVVLASTVGLEALAFGLPLGVLEIPGHGHVFDYVASGAATALSQPTLAADVDRLLSSPTSPRAAGYLDQHMAHRGAAAIRIADCLAELSTSRMS